MLSVRRVAYSVLPALLHRFGASITSATSLKALQDIIPTPPKKDEKAPVTGREWKAADLRLKSWDDLHKLWYVLLIEKNRLHSEKLMYKSRRLVMPDPIRITKVRKGMNRIKQVMSERLREHEDVDVRIQLKAFIDSM